MKIGEVANEAGREELKVLSGTAEYRMTTSVRRGARIAALSTGIDVTGAFRSGTTRDFIQLPLSAARFRPALAWTARPPPAGPSRFPSSVRIVVLTTFGEDEYVTRALAVGAAGFTGKGTGPQRLIHAVRVAVGGEAILSPRVPRGLIEQHVVVNAQRTAEARRLTALLTPRERDVFASWAAIATHEANLCGPARRVMSCHSCASRPWRGFSRFRTGERAQGAVPG
ncbi:hypothetical protein [Streptomyces sp. NPDC005476]|uniref:hypothetical protein n=1 Tax=Streptomyces sp. NPDC005476 TaxID=3156882 RepID=UPI0034565E33